MHHTTLGQTTNIHLQDDPAALLDITEDIHDEASKIGDVTKVVLYDEEADGVVMVRFLDPAAAVKCVKVSYLHVTLASLIDWFLGHERAPFQR